MPQVPAHAFTTMVTTLTPTVNNFNHQRDMASMVGGLVDSVACTREASKQPCSPSTTATNGSLAKKLKSVRIVQGIDPKKSLTLHNFDDPMVRALLLHSMKEYKVQIVVSNAFPKSVQCIEWAKACWANVQCEAGIEEPYEFTD